MTTTVTNGTTTAVATLLSPYAGPQGRQGWSLVLTADPGIPMTCGYGVLGASGMGPGPEWPIPKDTLTIAVGGPGQVASGAPIYLWGAVGASYTFTEIAR